MIENIYELIYVFGIIEHFQVYNILSALTWAMASVFNRYFALNSVYNIMHFPFIIVKSKTLIAHQEPYTQIK